MSELNLNIIIKMYVDEGHSVKAIAEQFGVYPNKVRRLLQKSGVELKTRGEIQREVLLSGKAEHPTKGKKHSAVTKSKISDQLAEYWDNVGDLEKQKRGIYLKEYWDNVTDAERAEVQKLSCVGRLKAAKVGSKFENFLGEYLNKKGLNVIVHKKGMIINDDLEIDILLPAEKIVIEVDGPSHYFPIHGEEKLEKQQKSDNEKNALLLNEGFVVIRFKHIVKNLTMKYKNDSAKEIYELVEKLKTNFPPVGKRLIYI